MLNANIIALAEEEGHFRFVIQDRHKTVDVLEMLDEPIGERDLRIWIAASELDYPIKMIVVEIDAEEGAERILEYKTITHADIHKRVRRRRSARGRGYREPATWGDVEHPAMEAEEGSSVVEKAIAMALQNPEMVTNIFFSVAKALQPAFDSLIGPMIERLAMKVKHDVAEELSGKLQEDRQAMNEHIKEVDRARESREDKLEQWLRENLEDAEEDQEEGEEELAQTDIEPYLDGLNTAEEEDHVQVQGRMET